MVELILNAELRTPRRLALRAALGRPYVGIMGAAGLLWLFLGLVHQLALVAAGTLISSSLGPNAAGITAAPAGGDEIYFRLVLGMLGSAMPAGLIPAPLGVDVLFGDGSSAVGVQLLEVGVNLLLAAAGTGLLIAAWARPRSKLARCVVSSPGARLAANMCLAYGIAAELRLSWTSGSGGEMALGMVATKLIGIDSAAYTAALEQGLLLSVGVNIVLLLLACLGGAMVGLVGVAILSRRRGLVRLKAALFPPRARRVLAPAGAIVLALALLPLQPGTRYVEGAAAPPAEPAVAETASSTAEMPSAAEPGAEASVARPPAEGAVSLPPSQVAIAQRPDGTFDYRVNGKSEFIRGVGYNPITKGQTSAQRAARFDRDFTAIAAMGVNTITGWDESEFDELLMAKAAEHGLGVILPFELRPAWAYDDPKVRQQILDDVGKRVERFKNSPALRMWGLGNEVLHGIVPRGGARANAFAAFLVEASDAVNRLDPNHPVLYRDAEDVFLDPVARALRAKPQNRPWFVYGMNFFTTRMEDALNKGPVRSFRQPVMISEFAPVGLRSADRAMAYVKLWNVIRSHRPMLLGGSAYVWSTAGPEPLDRGFGLTTETGEPVDGALAALTALFQDPSSS